MDLDPTAQTLTKAIAMQEGGGSLLPYGSASGDTGTSTDQGAGGRYQFMPKTWQNYAQQVLGNANAPMTPDNQNQVAYTKVKQWLDAGNTPAQAASMWNAGEGAPNAWKDTHQSNGNTPQYVKGVQKYAQKLSTGYTPPSQNPAAPSDGTVPGYAPPTAPQPITLPSKKADTTSGNQDQGFMADLKGGNYLGAFANAVNFAFPITKDIANDLTGTSQKTGLQQAGDLGLSALPFIPVVGEAARAGEGAGLVARAVASPITRNAAMGYGIGAASNLSQGQGIGQAISPNLNTLVGAATGGALGGTLGRFGTGEEGLQGSAQSDITKILNPTTIVNKKLTQQIAPRLAQEGLIAHSREALLEQAQEKAAGVGQELEKAYSALPDTAQMEVSNLFANLRTKADSLMINGGVPSASQGEYSALQKVTHDLTQLGLSTSVDGTQVFADVANVRQLRQILDTGKNKFAFTDLDHAAKGAQTYLANQIRGEFAQQYPDIAKINKDYSFWTKVSQVLEDTINRKTGQSGIIRKGIAGGLGAAGGLSQGHPVIGAAVMRMASDFINSTAWHTTSAFVKTKLANAIASGDSIAANSIIKTASKLLPGAGARGVQGLINQ